MPRYVVPKCVAVLKLADPKMVGLLWKGSLSCQKPTRRTSQEKRHLVWSSCDCFNRKPEETIKTGFWLGDIQRGCHSHASFSSKGYHVFHGIPFCGGGCKGKPKRNMSIISWGVGANQVPATVRTIMNNPIWVGNQNKTSNHLRPHRYTKYGDPQNDLPLTQP